MEKPGDEPTQELIESLACQLDRWGLTLPAAVFLEVAKPLSFIASQGLLLCQPFLSYLVEEPRLAGYADLLADRKNIDRLVVRLERDRPISGINSKEKG